METILLLDKGTFQIFSEIKLVNNTFESIPVTSNNSYIEIIELIKDLVQLNNLLKPSDDYVIMKLDTGKVVIYRQNPNNNLAVIMICVKKSYKKQSLTILSAIILNTVSFNEMTNQVSFKTKDFCLQGIEELTTKFIDYLRGNKLFPKFIYFNYNPSAASSIIYKKTKLESTSVILYNNNGNNINSKDYDKNQEQKDTLLQKSIKKI